jgi:hypothetical protein
METYELTAKQLSDIVDYLASKPFKEVYTLIGMIQSTTANVEKEESNG